MTEKPLREQSYLSFFQMKRKKPTPCDKQTKTSLILAYFLYAVTQVNELSYRLLTRHSFSGFDTM